MALKLYSTQQYIKKVNSFKSYIQKVKKSDDYNLVKERLLEAIDIMLFHLEDLRLSCESYKKIDTHTTLLRSFRNTIAVSQDSEDLVTVTSLLDLLNVDDFASLNEYHLDSRASDIEYNIKDSFIDLPRSYIEMLRKSINNESINTINEVDTTPPRKEVKAHRLFVKIKNLGGKIKISFSILPTIMP
mgnify:CR=1 FL=1